jgi:dipeptidyl-peptidase-4
MRKIWISILWLVAASNMGAADMMHLLGGGYDAKVMTPAELDSVLNGTTAVNTPSSGQYTSQNAAERYRLEYENAKKLFRHSFFADYYLVDTQKNTRIPLSDTQVRDAKLSPNGKYVVYAKADNNLYIYKVDFKTEVPVTTSNNLDIFNGITDWLYEEEFGITDLFYFSPDSKALAFVRLNETSVPAFGWQTYLPDSVTQDDGTYPTMHSLRYPKAGQANAKATVCVYDIHYKSIREMQIPANMDGYIPRLKWRNVTTNSKSSTEAMADLMILHLNRDQNKLDVLQCNAKSTVCHPFYTEYSDTYYVDYELFDEWQWLSDGKVVLLSEKSGYKQVYLHSSQGVEQKTLTTEKRDVTKVYGYDAKTKQIFSAFQSVKLNPKRGHDCGSKRYIIKG